jgi:hypothetical protein
MMEFGGWGDWGRGVQHAGRVEGWARGVWHRKKIIS